MSRFDFLWRKPQSKIIAAKTIAPSLASSSSPGPVRLPTMLILRGIAGHFAGRDWPRGALDEPPALEYARARGYAGEVLDVDGAIGPQSRQVRMCLEAIRTRNDIAALYGFSGGGYNIHHVLAALSAEARRRIRLVVVLGAPNNPPALYRDGPWELVYRRDPPAGHMAGPKALLAELASQAAANVGGNPLAGKVLRYLIGADDAGAGRDDEIVEVGYDVSAMPARGISIAYCNLFDERNTGKFGPYLHSSDTADKYHEGQIDPSGPGWERNLREQFERRKRQGFQYVELDNPDAYSVVVGAVDITASYGLKVIAKNPLLLEADPLPYMTHPAVVGVIVEQDAGTPPEMNELRRRARKPDLPIWFVAFGASAGRAWAMKTAQQAQPYRNMGVTFSPGSEYGSSIDILRPR